MTKPQQVRSLATLEKIMVAAEAVVAREGAAGLTMEGVAQQAGISKGGVLYHFRSKESLIARLASRKLLAMQEGMEVETQRHAGTPNASLHGVISQSAMTYGRDDGFSRAMLTAAVENSQSLELFRALFAERFARVRAESAESDAAAALLFAVIGMQVSRTLGFAELDLAQAAAVFDALRGMAAALPVRGATSEGKGRGEVEEAPSAAGPR